MVCRKIGPALAVGCTSVLKIPAETPFSCLALVELARRAGVPCNVINVISTDKNLQAVGLELCQNRMVKKISFTGSTRVGKLIMEQCCTTLKKLSMELGG
jgi:succinate-semialdehyde dehydrogenase / glutarate-semialdehyde dehydrogenase